MDQTCDLSDLKNAFILESKGVDQVVVFPSVLDAEFQVGSQFSFVECLTYITVRKIY